jgi:hypothetical protein
MIDVNWFLFSLFHDAFSLAQTIVSNKRMIGEWWIGKDVEGSGRSLLWSTILTFTWRDWEKPKILNRDSRPIFESRTPEYEAEVLTTQTWRLVFGVKYLEKYDKLTKTEQKYKFEGGVSSGILYTIRQLCRNRIKLTEGSKENHSLHNLKINE